MRLQMRRWCCTGECPAHGTPAESVVVSTHFTRRGAQRAADHGDAASSVALARAAVESLGGVERRVALRHHVRRAS